MRVAVAGLARNCAAELPQNLKLIEALAARCEELHCIIATNDNVDQTGRILAQWSKGNERAKIIDIPSLEHQLSSRADRLAYLRNRALAEARAMSASFTHFLVLDLDGPNTHTTATNVLSLMNGEGKGWSGLFANQRNAYYDLYALRKTGWIEEDVILQRNAAYRLLRRTPL